MKLAPKESFNRAKNGIKAPLVAFALLGAAVMPSFSRAANGNEADAPPPQPTLVASAGGSAGSGKPPPAVSSMEQYVVHALEGNLSIFSYIGTFDQARGKNVGNGLRNYIKNSAGIEGFESLNPEVYTKDWDKPYSAFKVSVGDYFTELITPDELDTAEEKAAFLGRIELMAAAFRQDVERAGGKAGWRAELERRLQIASSQEGDIGDIQVAVVSKDLN